MSCGQWAITGFIALLATAGAANAQEQGAAAPLPCTSYQQLARELAEHYKERPFSGGLQTDGRLLQVFVSPDGDTWTLLSTTPTGTSCIVAVGRGWETRRASAQEPQA
jgi:hypothetical protein